jgi:hypothetical protein
LLTAALPDLGTNLRFELDISRLGIAETA